MEQTCDVAAGLYCGIGMTVPIIPTLVGIGAAAVVRILLWSRKQSIIWNLCVLLLVVLATFATLEGEGTSTFFGFWIGISYGTTGQGILNMGKSAMVLTFKTRLESAMDAFMGTKTGGNSSSSYDERQYEERSRDYSSDTQSNSEDELNLPPGNRVE